MRTSTMTTVLWNVKFNSNTVSIRILKTGLSIFIVYHLLAILILPMGSGLIIRELGHHFIAYANHAGLNTTWQFFSPGPSAVFYLEYTYNYPNLSADDDALPVESEPQRIPEKRNGRMINDFYIRKLASLQYLAISPQRTEQFLVPWLCAKDKAAESITLRRVVGELENLERHRGEFGADSFAEMSETRTMDLTTINCPERVQ